MPRKSLRAQLNQIRAWVRQGRTDAWIAHQLEVSASELREFRRRHELSADGEDPGELDLRDEIEAEIEAATLEEELVEDEDDDLDEDEDEDEDDDEMDTDDDDEGARDGGVEAVGADDGAGEDAAAEPRRRRRRRGGRGKRAGAGLQASFDHGEVDGYGLWLDPVVADDPVYAEHWSGKRRVEVTIEPDRIVIVRSVD